MTAIEQPPGWVIRVTRKDDKVFFIDGETSNHDDKSFEERFQTELDFLKANAKTKPQTNDTSENR